jgi:hypothetical protein
MGIKVTDKQSVLSFPRTAMGGLYRRSTRGFFSEQLNLDIVAAHCSVGKPARVEICMLLLQIQSTGAHTVMADSAKS